MNEKPNTCPKCNSDSYDTIKYSWRSGVSPFADYYVCCSCNHEWSHEHETTLDDYTKALQSHDWYYMYSDDHRVYKKGRESADLIQSMQPIHDPDFAVWNEHAPDDCKVNK
jgi:transposase-like protein